MGLTRKQWIIIAAVIGVVVVVVGVAVGTVCGLGHCSSGCYEAIYDPRTWYKDGARYLHTGPCTSSPFTIHDLPGNAKVVELMGPREPKGDAGEPLQSLDVLISGDKDSEDSIYVDLAETEARVGYVSKWSVVFKVAGAQYMGSPGGPRDTVVYKERPQDTETYSRIVSMPPQKEGEVSTSDTFPFFISKNPGISLIYSYTGNFAELTVYETSIKWEMKDTSGLPKFYVSVSPDLDTALSGLRSWAQQETYVLHTFPATTTINPIKVYYLGVDRMMFLSFKFKSSGTDKLVIKILRGEWMSLPNSENKVRYYEEGSDVEEQPAALAWLTSGSDLKDIVFYKLKSVHTVTAGNDLTVRVFVSKSDKTIGFSKTIDIYEGAEHKGQVAVEYSYIDNTKFTVTFEPTPAFSTTVQIAAVEVYMFATDFGGDEFTIDNLTNEKVYKITEFKSFEPFPANTGKELTNKSGE